MPGRLLPRRQITRQGAKTQGGLLDGWNNGDNPVGGLAGASGVLAWYCWYVTSTTPVQAGG